MNNKDATNIKEYIYTARQSIEIQIWVIFLLCIIGYFLFLSFRVIEQTQSIVVQTGTTIFIVLVLLGSCFFVMKIKRLNIATEQKLLDGKKSPTPNKGGE